MQTDDERAHEGAEARRRRDAPALGVPIHRDEDDPTPPPQELYDLCANDEQRAELERTWAKTPQASTRGRRSSDPPPSTEDKWKKRIVAAALAALAASGGSLVAVANGLYERGSYEGRMQLRIDYLERQVEEMRQDLRSWRDRSRRNDSSWPPAPAPNPAPKGIAP